jgi:hypothetical protein
LRFDGNSIGTRAKANTSSAKVYSNSRIPYRSGTGLDDFVDSWLFREFPAAACNGCANGGSGHLYTNHNARHDRNGRTIAIGRIDGCSDASA